MFDTVQLLGLYSACIKLIEVIILSSKNKQLDTHFGIRMNTKDIKTFRKRCEKIGKDSAAMVREMIVAFNNNRLTIEIPKSKSEATEKVYVNRS